MPLHDVRRDDARMNGETHKLGSAIQRALPAGAEPAHEPVADQRGVARGLPDAGLVVDLRRQQYRAAFVEAPRYERVEMARVAHPMAVADAGAARDRHDVGGGGGRRLLLAGDLVDAVVHDDDG